MIIYFPGRTHLLHPALAHDDDLVGYAHGLRLVMCYVDGSDAHLLLYTSYLCTHGHTKLCVKITERFVEQKYSRLQDQGPGQGYSLLLSARKLISHSGLHTFHFNQLQNIDDLLMYYFLWQLSKLQAISHIVENIVMRKQGIALEYHGCITLVRGKLIYSF